jgi:hypothetical protein
MLLCIKFLQIASIFALTGVKDTDTPVLRTRIHRR